jgi:hypothetical protein
MFYDISLQQIQSAFFRKVENEFRGFDSRFIYYEYIVM